MTDEVLDYVEKLKKCLERTEEHLQRTVTEVERIEEEAGVSYPITSALRASASHALNELYIFLEAWDIYRYVLLTLKGEAVLSAVKGYKEGEGDETR